MIYAAALAALRASNTAERERWVRAVVLVMFDGIAAN
jgi:hypothetical protein